MLEGLEVSEVLLSNAKSITGYIRWDSEYYLKKYLLLYSKFNNENSLPFKEYCEFIKKGIFDLSPDNYQEQGVPFIRTSEIKYPLADFSSTVFLNQQINDCNYKTELKCGDLVFTKIGAYIGDVAMLPKDFSKYNFSQNVAGAKIKNKFDSPYLLALFLSDIGKSQILRSLMLSGQGKLELEDIRNYRIPNVSETLKKSIAKLIEKSEKCIYTSKLMYKEAEQYLIESIGLKDFVAKKEVSNVKSFKESFLASGRFDAEYYQTKFDDLFELLSKYDCNTLDNLVNIKKSVEPGSDAYQDNGIPFIRVQDLSMYGILETDVYLSPKEFSNIIRTKKDTILLSKDGSVGIAYKVEEDSDYITSGAILHLSIKKETILPDYLTLVLNSKIVKMQAERDAGGSIIQHWKPSEIKEVIIPILPIEEQRKLSNKIQNSFSLRKEAKKLLEEAKQIVEENIQIQLQ